MVYAATAVFENTPDMSTSSSKPHHSKQISRIDGVPIARYAFAGAQWNAPGRHLRKGTG